MKMIYFSALIFLALSLFVPSGVYGKNKNKIGNNKAKNDFEQAQQSKHNSDHRYEYRGQYKNFNDNNHKNRYYYHGNYYNFHDYYRYYRSEENVFTYEGAYERHGDVFIFSDRYGNEFDLYVKPVSYVSKRFRGYPIYPGNTYNIRLNPTKMYPAPSELRVGISFAFGWGNLVLQENRYFDMYTAPELVNLNGRLYIR